MTGSQGREPKDLSADRVTVPPHVAVKRFVNETVMLNIRTGQYHSLDEVGTAFLDELIAGPDLATTASRLASRYEQPVERLVEDLGTFVAELDRRDLVAFGS